MIDIINNIGVILAVSGSIMAIVIAIKGSTHNNKKTDAEADNLRINTLSGIIDELKQELARQKENYDEKFLEQDSEIRNLKKEIDLLKGEKKGLEKEGEFKDNIIKAKDTQIWQFDQAFSMLKTCERCQDNILNCPIYNKFNELVLNDEAKR